MDLVGVFRRLIEHDRAAHDAFVAPPPYIVERNERLCAEADEREAREDALAAHRAAKANARRERREAEEEAARQDEIDRQTQRLARLISDNVVDQIRRPR